MPDIKNAKEELLRIVNRHNLDIIGAYIEFGEYYGDEDKAFNTFVLNPLYKKEDFDNFLKFMDREYNSGYGGQEIYGIVYCENGIWMDRGEYDGSEWWQVNQYPDMRNHFDEVVVLRYLRYKKIKEIESLKKSP